MKLLLDECLPRKLKSLFVCHDCTTVQEAGFGGKENGELLSVAEGRFEVFITIDKNIRYQQNITGRKISILIIRAKTNDISDIQPQITKALVALQSILPGQIVEVGQP